MTEILVTSFGGCASNSLVHILKHNDFRLVDGYDEHLCHASKPPRINIKMIYLYNDPIHSWLSQINRGLTETNVMKLSDHRFKTRGNNKLLLLKLMIRQFKNWTSAPINNLLIIKTSELFTQEGKIKLERFLKPEVKPGVGKQIEGLPMVYRQPKSLDCPMSLEERRIIKYYIKDINHINKYKNDLY